MKIAFYAAQCLPVHAHSLEERPLGGTETGLVRLAQILHDRGHDVTVFTSMKDPPPSQPRYLHFQQLFQCGSFDVFVMVKEWLPAFYGVPALKRLFWTGDGFDQFVNYGLGDHRVVEKLDGFLVVSRWQAESLCEASGFPMEKCFFLGNGVHLPYFEGEETREPRRLIYASAPYRGLDIALKAFVELRREIEDLELHIFSGFDVYNTDKEFQGPLREQFRKLEGIIRQTPGCVLHGNLTQRALAREYMKAACLFYPNSTFETCCIVALEAIAGGCPVIASNNSALPETVGECGVVINGVPGSPEYMEELIRVTRTLLLDTPLWNRFHQSAEARRGVNLSWEHVASRFEGLFL